MNLIIVSDLVFTLHFIQMAVVEIVLLAAVAGLIGPQIVARRLAFFSHGLGAGAFPGLVLAAAWGIQPQLAALATGALMAAGLNGLVRFGRVATDAATSLLLVASLAIGVILASNVFRSGSGVDNLLFGTLLGIGAEEIRAATVVLVAVAVITAVSRRTWNLSAFDFSGALAMRLPVVRADWLLLIAVALAVVVTVDAVGALLVGTVLVIPAATARVAGLRVSRLGLATFLIAAAEGVLGIWLAYRLNVPPGAAVTVVAGLVYAVVAAAVSLRSHGNLRSAGATV